MGLKKMKRDKMKLTAMIIMALSRKPKPTKGMALCIPTEKSKELLEMSVVLGHGLGINGV